jgi:hypothetical protein
VALWTHVLIAKDQGEIINTVVQRPTHDGSLSKPPSGTLIIKTSTTYAHYQNLHQVRSLSKPPSGTLIIKIIIKML